MFGRGKPQPGVLIEPSARYTCDPDNDAKLIKYRNLVWYAFISDFVISYLSDTKLRPVIEEANRIGPTFARLFKETIVIVNPCKPLPRAAKGTVMRKQALALYAEEIEHLSVDLSVLPLQNVDNNIRYRTLEDSSDARGISPPESWKPDALQPWILEHVASLNNEKAPPLDADIFAAGFDR